MPGSQQHDVTAVVIVSQQPKRFFVDEESGNGARSFPQGKAQATHTRDGSAAHATILARPRKLRR